MRVRGRLAGQAEVVDVVVAGDRIETIGPPVGTADLGGGDCVLSPAFIDLQVNGYGGLDFNLGVWNDQPVTVETAAQIVRKVAASGTGLLCPTLITNRLDWLEEGLRTVAAACTQDAALAASLPGIHLEGPFLSPDEGPRGAHDPAYIIDPDWSVFERLQAAASGLIRILTIAPERPGAIAFIERAVASGVLVSIGHSHATAESVRDAVAAGASLSTHLGNGAHAVLPRHHNYIWEQLAEDHLTACIIADGHHLPPNLVKCFSRIKGPSRLVVVSDCVALGGLPPGLYSDGRHEVLPSGRVNLAGTPYLAGAGHLLDTCVATLRRCTDFSEAEVVGAVTSRPAAVLGLSEVTGQLAPGRRADLTCFRWPEGDGPLTACATVVAGNVLYRA